MEIKMDKVAEAKAAEEAKVAEAKAKEDQAKAEKAKAELKAKTIEAGDTVRRKKAEDKTWEGDFKVGIVHSSGSLKLVDGPAGVGGALSVADFEIVRKAEPPKPEVKKVA